MIDAISSVLQLLFASFGVTAGLDAGPAITCAIVFALAVIVVLLHAIVQPRSVRTSLSRARRAIDVSAVPSQSDPDAAGHSRSRAPGVAASAA